MASRPAHFRSDAQAGAALQQLLEILRPERRTIIVDVGASPIEVPPYAFLRDVAACDVFGFEPQADELASLNAKKRANEHYLQTAVGSGTEVTFYATRHPGFSSTLRPNLATCKGLNRWHQDTQILEQSTLKTERLDDLQGLPKPDLLKIDIQGGEKDAIENGRELLSLAVTIISEVSAIPIYENQPLLDDQIRTMRSLGFGLHKFEFLRKVPIRTKLSNLLPKHLVEDQLTDGDAIFVRSVLELDQLSTEQLKHLCILSCFVYGSFSLGLKALEILREKGAVEAKQPNDFAKTLAKSF